MNLFEFKLMCNYDIYKKLLIHNSNAIMLDNCRKRKNKIEPLFEKLEAKVYLVQSQFLKIYYYYYYH